MPPRIYGVITLALAQLLINPVRAQADPALQAITDLSQLNGQALACQEFTAATRAKNLMLQHSPKTARYGSAFDEGTHQAFVEQTRSPTPCPDAKTLSAQLEALALKLQTILPAAVPTNGVQ
jgi:hypothetical protein